MSALKSSSLPACRPANHRVTLSIYLHSILIQPRWKADLLVRGSTSIHYLMGERLQTVRLATGVSDTLRWPGQRRAAWPNTNMLSHLLHHAWAVLNPPCPWPCCLHPLKSPSFLPSLAFRNPAGETVRLPFIFPEACSARAGLSVAVTSLGNGREGGGGRSSFIDMQQTAVAEQRPLSSYWESRSADRVVD